MLEARIRQVSQDELEDDLLQEFVCVTFAGECQWFAMDVNDCNGWQTIEMYPQVLN